jgi:hypothetical protein
MTDRLLGTVPAGIDSSSERLDLLQKILSDTLDDELLQTLSGNYDTAREVRPKKKLLETTVKSLVQAALLF